MTVSLIKKRKGQSEYRKYHSSTKMKKDRAARNKARRLATRQGKVSKGDRKEVDHVDGNPRNNSKRNVRVVPRRHNRKKQ